MMGLVIGLHGAKGSGKDQFYKAVKAAFPLRVIRKIAYADPIKNEVSDIFKLNSEEDYDNFKRTFLEFKLGGGFVHQVEGRHVVREIGMLMRRYDEHQFVRHVEEGIRKEPDTIWCVTDLRFANELNSIKHLNGIVIKIKRSGFDFDGHVTEKEFPDNVCDHIIYNTRELTIEEYDELAINTMNNILLKRNTL
jgi:hypothetical protein